MRRDYTIASSPREH